MILYESIPRHYQIVINLFLKRSLLMSDPLNNRPTMIFANLRNASGLFDNLGSAAFIVLIISPKIVGSLHRCSTCDFLSPTSFQHVVDLLLYSSSASVKLYSTRKPRSVLDIFLDFRDLNFPLFKSFSFPFDFFHPLICSLA